MAKVSRRTSRSPPLNFRRRLLRSPIDETPKPRLCETRALFARDVGLARHFDPRIDCKLRGARLFALAVILGVFPSCRAVGEAFIALSDGFHFPPQLRVFHSAGLFQ